MSTITPDMPDDDLIRARLRAVLTDAAASDTAVVSAARTLAEMNGLLRLRTPAEDPVNGKSLSEMSAEELEAAAAESRAQLAQLKAHFGLGDDGQPPALDHDGDA